MNIVIENEFNENLNNYFNIIKKNLYKYYKY